MKIGVNHNIPRILMVRIAWMKYYEGYANIDIPRSGAKYILKHKTGGETNNFKNRNGKYYGFIPFVNSLDINKLGADSKDEFIKNVTVVFCSTHPVEKGMRIVGWYKNATVYRSPKTFPFLNWCFVEADAKNVTRIDAGDRVLNIPGLFGRSAVFYFSKHPEKKKILLEVLDYIESGGIIETTSVNVKSTKNKVPRQPDIEKRILVETTAVNLAKNYYSKRYGAKNVISVEKDNVGWDLEIKAGDVKLKVEVKGLSGNEQIVELTPNEFKALDAKRETYYLFIVTNALGSKPDYEIFSRKQKGEFLIGHKKTVLKINKITGAKISKI